MTLYDLAGLAADVVAYAAAEVEDVEQKRLGVIAGWELKATAELLAYVVAAAAWLAGFEAAGAAVAAVVASAVGDSRIATLNDLIDHPVVLPWMRPLAFGTAEESIAAAAIVAAAGTAAELVVYSSGTKGNFAGLSVADCVQTLQVLAVGTVPTAHQLVLAALVVERTEEIENATLSFLLDEKAHLRVLAVGTMPTAHQLALVALVVERTEEIENANLLFLLGGQVPLEESVVPQMNWAVYTGDRVDEGLRALLLLPQAPHGQDCSSWHAQQQPCPVVGEAAALLSAASV